MQKKKYFSPPKSGTGMAAPAGTAQTALQTEVVSGGCSVLGGGGWKFFNQLARLGRKGRGLVAAAPSRRGPGDRVPGGGLGGRSPPSDFSALREGFECINIT